MSEIIGFDQSSVKIGVDDGRIIDVPLTALNYPDPRIGDKVSVYQGNGQTVVSRDTGSQAPLNPNEKRINKHLFVWLGAFVAGGFGADRFMRGQIGLGICKLLFGWLTLGIWPLVDWIIALSKAYGGAFGNSDDVVFIDGHYAA